ncbi:MAG: YwbE family protein [Clostridia bacterium]
MNGQIRDNIKIGAKVAIVLKADQPTGKLTEGTVAKILTNSQTHPHGIKVMLEDDRVGRVQKVL